MYQNTFKVIPIDANFLKKITNIFNPCSKWRLLSRSVRQFGLSETGVVGGESSIPSSLSNKVGFSTNEPISKPMKLKGKRGCRCLVKKMYPCSSQNLPNVTQCLLDQTLCSCLFSCVVRIYLKVLRLLLHVFLSLMIGSYWKSRWFFVPRKTCRWDKIKFQAGRRHFGSSFLIPGRDFRQSELQNLVQNWKSTD